MAFLDLIAELTGTLPGLSPILAETYINRALTGIYDERNWSFFVTDGVLICPAVITNGAVAITQYAATITLDATASAAVQAQVTGTALPGILQLQIRFGASSTLGGIYSIIAVDNTTPAAVILTLDRVVLEATNAASTFQIYRCYVVPPIADFKRWESLVDIDNAMTLTGDRLSLMSSQLDTRDPQRAAQGLAYYLASWGGNRASNPNTGATIPNATQNAGTPIYELWPHPTNGQTFYCRFRRKGDLLINPTDVQQPGISDNLIIQRALFMHAYPFAAANAANFPSFKNANWQGLIVASKQFYATELLEAKRNDDEQQLQTVWSRGHGLRTGTPFGRFGDMPYPVDSNFIQSHLVRF